MNRLLSILTAATVVFAISACDKVTDQQPVEKGSISITAGQDTPVFDAKGSVKSVTFSATTEWTAAVINTKADDWISISPSSGGKGENSLFITVADNYTNDERTATIEIKCGEAKRQIIATQKQKNALTVTKSKFEVSASGETITIEVKSNVDYAVSIDDNCASWIDKQQTKAMSTTTFHLLIAENNELEKRDGKVTISSGTLSETIYIYQAGAAPTIILGQNEYVVPSSGETITVQVSHNVPTTYVLPQGISWISEVNTKAMSTNAYQFAIAENVGLDNREAEITFINTENNLSETVRIIQMQKDELDVAKSEYYIPRKGGGITISVGHNVDFLTSIDVDWIDEVDTKAFTTDEIVFSVKENSTGVDRTGAITFTSNNGNASQVVKVIQAGLDVIDLSTNGTANCYIIPSAGFYKFNACVKGNSTESVGTPVKAEVLWESFGTYVQPNVGDIITNVEYHEGYVVFSTPASLVDGNALVAVKDVSNNILWSWHIWVCNEFNPSTTEQAYGNNAGTMMDRNLGALTDERGNIQSYGLYYQWGRKDPFVGDTKWASPSLTVFPQCVSKSSSTGTISYSVSHPYAIIYAGNYDWSNTSNNNRWDDTKTKYDPCPYGWRVATGGTSGVWATASGCPNQFTEQYDSTFHGVDCSNVFNCNNVWYPCAGFRESSSGEYNNREGDDLNIWSCSSVTDNYAYYFDYNKPNIFLTSAGNNTTGSKSYARNVRCQRINM